MKNPYQVLGIGRDADDKAIKEAYRRLARKHHPDVNPGDRAAEERFKDIQAAYDLLSDPERRAAFDRFGERAFAPGGGAGFDPRQAGGGRMPSFEDIFGPGALQDILSGLFGGAFGGGAGPAGSGGTDLEGEIDVSFEEAFRGVEKGFTLPGDGARGAPLRVRIPAGVEDGALLKVPGRGRSGRRGTGDLYLRVRVRPDPRFERQGADLFVDLPLSLTEAALGAELAVPTPTGEARVRIAPGTPSGRLVRLPGRGFPRPSGRGAGDLFARIRIVPPPAPSPEERRILEELARVSTFRPRPR